MKIRSEFFCCFGDGGGGGGGGEKKRGQRGWTTIFQNKCCILCLILVTVTVSVVIGLKIVVDAILNEVEVASFNTTYKGPGGAEATKWTEENFVQRWSAPKEISETVKATFSGFDYENNPVWILPFGKWDIRGLLNAKPENEKLMKIFAHACLENLFESMKLRNSTGWVLICDMDEYSYSQMASFSTIKFILQTAKSYQPLLNDMAYGFTINLDSFSNALVNLIKPIAGSMMERVEMIGTDKEDYVEAMLKRIPANQLPQKYGGSMDYRPVATY